MGINELRGERERNEGGKIRWWVGQQDMLVGQEPISDITKHTQNSGFMIITCMLHTSLIWLPLLLITAKSGNKKLESKLTVESLMVCHSPNKLEFEGFILFLVHNPK